MSRRLEVLLHSQRIGQLTESPGGAVEFRFLASYYDLVPRPVLGQKFEDDLERVHRSRRGLGLPDFFANLLPEGRLREVIEKSAGIEAGDDLALLAFVGQDLPGAIVIRSGEGEVPGPTSRPQGASSSAENPSAESDQLRFSLAGVQLKFSMLREGETLTLPARDQRGEWIVKFDSPSFPQLPENEHSMLEWARAAGFDVPECHLHDLEDVRGFPRELAPAGGRVLAIRRYDRGPEGRIHQEDVAQAVGLPLSRKYDQITYDGMAHLVRRTLDEEAVLELVRRLVFVIASGNNDAHLKNWAFLYPDGIRARWSPLYDQVATVAWEGPDRTLALKLAGVKQFDRIEEASFERLAERTELDRRRVLDLVGETMSELGRAWNRISSDTSIPDPHAEALQEHWRRVPILRKLGSLA